MWCCFWRIQDDFGLLWAFGKILGSLEALWGVFGGSLGDMQGSLKEIQGFLREM